MRNLLLAIWLAGCSSTGAATADDLSAGPADLSASRGPDCTFAFSGDESGTQGCERLFCQPTADSLLRLYSFTGDTEMSFAVDGQFTSGRSYTVADLKSFSARSASRVPARFYVGSTVTLTLTDVVPIAAPCPSSGTAHGTAQLGLVEVLADDGGTSSPGHVTIDATF